MSRARASVPLKASRADAFDLWVDLRRWPAFIEGFARIVETRGEWPRAGSEIVWESVRGGRGRVSERVVTCEPPELLVTRVEEERLDGAQTLSFGEDAVALSLDYALTGSGLLQSLTDLLFIRRAQGEALARTLRRFAAEQAEL